MFIHIGNRITVSDRRVIGIFNAETLRMSGENRWILEKTSPEDRSVAVYADNNITCSTVSPFTVIKRTSLKKEYIWSKENEQGL